MPPSFAGTRRPNSLVVQTRVESARRDNFQYQQALAEILSATERAGSGVGELLELARLDSGQAQPRKTPLRIDLLVEEVAASMRVHGVEIVPWADETIVVTADYALLRHVLENLAHNAAARATEVELSVGRAGTTATVAISNNGPGFDDDILPLVFERFRRATTGDRPD